jgi:hypothetical protein
MISLRQALGSTVAWLVVILASCAAPPAPGHPERVDEMCSASCSRRAACGADADEPSCEADCRETGGKKRKYWRSDYVDAVSSCLRALPCGAARSASERRKVCFANSLPAPSPTAMRFANLAVSQDLSCHVFYNDPPTVAKRARDFGVYDDQVLEQMIACQEQGCTGHDTRWQCAMNVIGDVPHY